MSSARRPSKADDAGNDRPDDIASAPSSTESPKHRGSDHPRHSKVDRVQEAVEDLLERMRSDNPANPVQFLANAISSPGFERQLSYSDLAETPIAVKVDPKLRQLPLTIVVFGASGDLAKKKTFPALFSLFRNGLLPGNTAIVGYGRSDRSVEDLHKSAEPHFPKNSAADAKKFFESVSYTKGDYSESAMKTLEKHLEEREEDMRRHCVKCSHKEGGANRIFYLAIPPSGFVDACKAVSTIARKQKRDGPAWTRVVVEKPFGHDTESSRKLADELTSLLREDQLYRIDHYLGKEMVQNLVTLRFANHVFGALWNNNHIKNVKIVFKETIGTEGRGQYFDQNGIIRDVMQNHLTQILALITMEKPRSLDAEDIRDAKVAALRAVKPVELDNCVLGQYTAPEDGSEKGYLDDPGVPKDSNCPTFASIAMFVHNDRWDGVPFIMKAGKALDRKEVIIRVQFREEILPFGDRTQRNELVIRAQPNEAMYLKIATKAPGIGNDVTITELDLTYKERFDDVRLPEAYESLINEVVRGDATNFVRSDELDAAWQIFTPLLHQIDAGRVRPTPYHMGSRGPEAADALERRMGYIRTRAYDWVGPTGDKPQPFTPYDK